MVQFRDFHIKDLMIKWLDVTSARPWTRFWMVTKLEPGGDWEPFTAWRGCKCFKIRRLSFSLQNFRAVLWNLFTRSWAAEGDREALG